MDDEFSKREKAYKVQVPSKQVENELKDLSISKAQLNFSGGHAQIAS